MPPKAKFTREEIIEAALSIVRDMGKDAVTAREIGKRLGSSARPIFTIFENMEEVLLEVEKAARAVYKEYVERGISGEIAFKGVGTEYIRFAMEEPKLFQLLFMVEKKKKAGISEILEMIDESYEKILDSVRVPYGLDRDTAQRMYQHLWIYTHGIAALCATGVCSFKQEELSTMMTEVFTGLLIKLKGEKQDDKG